MFANLILTGGSSLMSIVLYVLVVGGVMYFFLIRPQKKRQQQHQEMLEEMQPGSEAITIGGLHGVISEIDDTKKTVTLDCEGVYLEFDRHAIARVQNIQGTPAAVGSEETSHEAHKQEEIDQPEQVENSTSEDTDE